MPARTLMVVAILAGVELAPFGFGSGAQQAPPATEIYLARLSRDAYPLAGGPSLNISSNPGYDNQPSFTADGSAVLFTSNRDGKQTDIYRYDLATKALTQLTHTSESEYSPLVTPDGKTFSVIRVEADGTQRLWRFDLDGSNPRLVLEQIKPVGYHVWIDATHLGLFVLGSGTQPATLQLADTATGTAEVIESGIGRCLAIRPGAGTLTFVSKPRNAAWTIKELDLKTRAVVRVIDTPEGSEDYAWDPAYRNPASNRLFMARGAKLMMWTTGAASWTEVGDLATAEIAKITRLTIAGQTPAAGPRLAFVAEPPAK